MRQACLHRLGCFVQTNSNRLLLASSLALILLCAAIRSAHFDSNITEWIQKTPRVESELNYVASALGEFQGSSHELVLQAPKEPTTKHDALSVESMLVHLKALEVATQVTVDMFELPWSLNDICYSPTLPDFDGLQLAEMLQKIVPCVIKTPLDCFWEGAKLLNPDQPIKLGSFGPDFKWTNLNPMAMVENIQQNAPNSAYPYSAMFDWMRRIGITSGYQFKPCLNPMDDKCPYSAPNKFTKEPPNVGAQLTGGCRGFATNLMHWKEEEIVGGLVKNKSGHITRANALQSSILLMDEQDMYDYHRGTSKVQSIYNWSAEKSRLIIDTWQQRFREELARFGNSSQETSYFNIHAITSKSMLEPIDQSSLKNLDSFKLCFIIMTLFSCVMCLTFETTRSTELHQIETEPKSQWLQSLRIHAKKIAVALVGSLFVGLTYISSLGLSSFLNLPFNMATTQILPPLALYYGFNQFLLIAKVYSQQTSSTSTMKANPTVGCLNEIFPVIMITSISYIIALLAASLIPVQATRVLAFQAITFIVLTTITNFTVTPSLLNSFFKPKGQASRTTTTTIITTRVSPKSSQNSVKRCKSRTGRISPASPRNDIDLEDVFSRIQEDLKHIQADSQCPSDIDFSASIGPGGLKTSFTLGAQNNFDSQSRANFGHNQLPVERPRNPPPYQRDPYQNPVLPDLISSNYKMNQETELQKDDLFEHQKIDCPKESNKPVDSESGSKPSVLNVADSESALFKVYADCLTDVRLVRLLIIFLKAITFAAIISYSFKVRYGLSVKDIVAQNTQEYESLVIAEKYFPIYNTYIITKGNFDYPTNQRLLYDLHDAVSRVEGVLRDDDLDRPRFWLAAFRDWLLDIQRHYDTFNKNNKTDMIIENWPADATDNYKLAVKLLAQTGRLDNPVDKSIVDTNRLVDANGIINPKGFYYYLTAWVITDAFTYSACEANFKPEPKVWNGNPDDLKIERARPLSYTQIPFLLELSDKHDSLKRISEIRKISEFFEQLIPNFPTGVPFIFWDQFLKLDLVYMSAASIALLSIFAGIWMMTSDLAMAAIITLPAVMSSLELYGLMGLLSIPFNNILAVLLISSIGIAIVQSVQYTTVSTHIN